jgi:hypothetical protein
MEENKNFEQIEDPIVSKIKKELESPQEKEAYSDLPAITPGTNKLLWNAPIYIAVNIDMKDDNIENPNEVWAKWAEEQLKNQS